MVEVSLHRIHLLARQPSAAPLVKTVLALCGVDQRWRAEMSATNTRIIEAPIHHGCHLECPPGPPNLRFTSVIPRRNTPSTITALEMNLKGGCAHV